MFQLTRLVSVSVFVLCFSIMAFSQAVPAKSVLINSAAFYDEKEGIAKLVSAEKQIDIEFAKDIKELQDGSSRLAMIAAELEKAPITASNQAALKAKKEEGEALQRQLGYKKADVEAAINKRRETLIGPITFDIGKAITEYGKKNGFGAIFDASKLADAGALLFVGDSVDVTKEFIAYYNARSIALPIR